MNKKTKLLVVFSIIILLAVIIKYQFFSTRKIDDILNNNQSAVTFKDESLFTLGNQYADRAVQDYLLAQPDFSWVTKKNGQRLCVFEKLDEQNDLFPFYLWVRCGEFVLENNELMEISGISGPAKIDYFNELSYYDLSKFSHTVPRDGSLYSKDIENIFSQDLQKRITNFDSTAINQRIKQVAQNHFTEI